MKGKLKQDKYEQLMGLLSTTLSYDDLKDADLPIEAVFEEMGVKEKVPKETGLCDETRRHPGLQHLDAGRLTISPTSPSAPQDVVGLHFFSPANVMKLLAAVRGAKTGKDVLATVMANGQEDQEDGRSARSARRLYRHRTTVQYGRQGGFLLDEGCTPEQVDKAIGTRDGYGPLATRRQRHRAHRAPHRKARHTAMAKGRSGLFRRAGRPSCCTFMSGFSM